MAQLHNKAASTQASCPKQRGPRALKTLAIKHFGNVVLVRRPARCVMQSVRHPDRSPASSANAATQNPNKADQSANGLPRKINARVSAPHLGAQKLTPPNGAAIQADSNRT